MIPFSHVSSQLFNYLLVGSFHWILTESVLLGTGPKSEPAKFFQVTTSLVIKHFYWLISQNDPLLTWILPSIEFFPDWNHENIVTCHDFYRDMSRFLRIFFQVTTSLVMKHFYWLISQNDPLLTWILPSIQLFAGWNFSLNTDWKCFCWVLVKNLNQKN